MQDPSADGEPPVRPSSWRHVESVALLACVGLLLWLQSLPPMSLPDGFLGVAGLSLLLALAAGWLAPGYVLWRLSSRDGPHPWWEAIPFSFGLGLAWLLFPAGLVMLVQSDMATLSQAVRMANTVLGLGYVGLPGRGRLPAPPRGHDGGPAEKRPSVWLLTAALAAAGRALYVTTLRPYRFTGTGDEWIYMRSIRRFLEAARIHDPHEFDVWDVALGLVFRFSGLEVVGSYRRLLAPVLMLVALAAFLALAHRVFGELDRACTALTILLVYGLSDMYMRGEGAGMGLFVRIAEDKY